MRRRKFHNLSIRKEKEYVVQFIFIIIVLLRNEKTGHKMGASTLAELVTY